MEYSAKLEEHVPGASGIDFLTQSRCILKIRASDDGNVFNSSDVSDVYNPAEDARCTDHLDLSTGIVTITVVDINDPPIPAVASFTISESATGSAAFNDLVWDKFPWRMPTFPADISRSSSATDVHLYSVNDPTNTFSIVDYVKSMTQTRHRL